MKIHYHYSMNTGAPQLTLASDASEIIACVSGEL